MSSDLEKYLSDNFHLYAARIRHIAEPYPYPTMETAIMLAQKRGPEDFSSFLYEHTIKWDDDPPEVGKEERPLFELWQKLDEDELKMWKSLDQETRDLFVRNNLGEIDGWPIDERECEEKREDFIKANVEGPCQGIVRKLMVNGKVTFASNAFNDSTPKGVIWYEPEDMQRAVYDGCKGYEAWREPERVYWTDLTGQTYSTTGEQLYEPCEVGIDFSDVIPDAKAFEQWINDHPGSAERPAGPRERCVDPVGL